ncbi:hypothetical protein Tco_1364989, partial [Tanacetum coccineum]
MTKVTKEEFEKLELFEIDEDLFTYDTQLGMIINEFNRLSRINDDLFACEIEIDDVTVEQWLDLKYRDHKTMDKNVKKAVMGTWLIKSYKLQFEEYLEIERQRETYAREVDMEYNPSNLVYWMRGDDEVILSDEEVSDLKDNNNNDDYEIAEIFRIETNLFDYETPLCTKFKEFNYLLKVDTELFTHDIERTKTYEDYESKLNNEVGKPWSKDGVPYEICDHICEPFRFKNGKAKCPPAVQMKTDSEQEDKEICELFDDPTQEPSFCKIRRFEIIKYSFGQEEEYVAIKEYEYDDLTRTNDDACHAYQEIFRNMDEGWLVTRAD